MTTVRCNGIELAYERLGDPAAPAVLLIMGLGGQLVSWPDPLCQDLVDAGYQVVRFDNRDVGLSSKLDHHGTPNLHRMALAAALRRPLQAPYRLDDMAQDAVSLLDALDITDAHLVGASMGGMIAQILAAKHAHRTLSLASLMSTSGHPLLPGPSLKLRLRLARKRSADPETEVRESMHTLRLIGSPGYPQSDEELREKVVRQLNRSLCPDGTARQIAAILASGSRTSLLEKIRAPTLILHGADDPLVPVAAARDLARRIPHAIPDIIPGMGHDLPPSLLPRISASLLSHLERASSATAPLRATG